MQGRALFLLKKSLLLIRGTALFPSISNYDDTKPSSDSSTECHLHEEFIPHNYVENTSYDSSTEFDSCEEFVPNTHSVATGQGRGRLLTPNSIETSKEVEISIANDPNREFELNL